MKKSKGFHTPKGGHHTNPKPRLRTRHLSSVGKSAYAGPAAAGGPVPAFPPPGGAPGGPAFDPGAGGGDSAPLGGPGGGPPGM